MKKVLLFALLAALVGCQQNAGKQPVEIKTQTDKVSYSIGVDIGQSFLQQDFGLNSELIAQGLADAMNEKELKISEEERAATLQQFQEDRMAKQTTGKKEAGELNIKEGAAFLAENKTKEGVITTASGLQYKIITPGTGRTPKATDTVETHYRGTLINGKEFDSSYKRGEPISFPVNGVIGGWTEALLLMKEGAKWQLFIPSDLAYGPRGADIGPNAMLIFDIELISVK